MRPTKTLQGQVLHHIAVFVLTATIICMQVQVGFTEAVSSKEMMQHADDVVHSLASINCLVNQVIYLLKGMLLIASCVVILIGVIPGPNEPKLTINTYLEPLVKELQRLWKGVVMKNAAGSAIIVRAALTCCV